MKKLKVVLSDKAKKDFNLYIDAIIFDYSSPLTAIKHYQALSLLIRNLSTIGNSIAPNYSNEVLRFGIHLRRVNYKKMAILFSIKNETIYIKHIIPQNMLVKK